MRDQILFEYEIAVITLIHNESRYLGEWLEYHFRLGVDKFYIYDVESEDHEEVKQILAPWIQSGVVDYNDQTKIGDFLQTLEDTTFLHRCDCRYLCMLSVYEFIFVKNGQTLLDFVNEHFSRNVATASLAITRIHFGSSNEEFYKPESVVERFTYRSPEDMWLNKRITSIMNPRRIREIDHDAFARYYAGALAFDENQNWIQWENTPIQSTEKIQVNSYFVKSKQEFDESTKDKYPNFFKYRSPDIWKDINEDAFEETGFRDFFREFMKRPMRKINPHGSQIVFENLVKMLEPIANPNAPDKLFEGNSEKFMTCFLLALRLENVNEKKRRAIELLSLQSLYHSMTLPDFRMWEIIWIIDSLPEFLQSKSEQAMKIIRGCKSLMDELILDVASMGKNWEDYMDLMYRRRLINALF